MKNVKRIITMLLTLALFISMAVPTEAAKKEQLNTEMDAVKGTSIFMFYSSDTTDFESTNPKVVSMDSSGYGRALKKGDAKITSTDSKGKKHTCTVHVYPENTLKKKLKIKYTPYTFSRYSYTLMTVENKSKATFDVDMELVYSDNSKKKHTTSVHMNNFHPGTTRVFTLSKEVNSVDIKYKFDTTRYQYDDTDLIDYEIEPQDDNAFLTVKNGLDKTLSVNMDIIGYDSDDNIVFMDRFYEVMEGKETSHQELNFRSKGMDENYQIAYAIPDRYEVYLNTERSWLSDTKE